MKKTLMLVVMVLGMVATGFAQSDKVKDKAMEKAEELNEQIIAGDAALALSSEQKKKVYQLHVDRIMETRKLRKDGAEQAEIKKANKKYYQQIFKDVLTKEQMKARKAGKDEDED